MSLRAIPFLLGVAFAEVAYAGWSLAHAAIVGVATFVVVLALDVMIEGAAARWRAWRA